MKTFITCMLTKYSTDQVKEDVMGGA